jgi:hypothetical protein
MDSRDFDQLARIIGAGRTRRGVFKALAGGALGAVAAAAGFRPSIAASHARLVGNSCSANVDCASGLCVKESRSRKICACVSPADCPPATDPCHSASCSAGACGFTVNTGASCNDSNLCTLNDICQPDGSCAGTPVVCQALDQCHVPGVCNRATGVCSNPNIANGMKCDDGAACTTGDVCINGACKGVPVVCPAPTTCQVSVACDPSSGSCVAVNQPDGTECGAVSACAHDVCQAGACVANVPKPKGTVCNDQDSCTQTDACDGAGACVGGDPVGCPPADSCHAAGVCDQGSGKCQPGALLSGTCFINGDCYAAGGLSPVDSCLHCDPAQSQTDFSVFADYTACEDGDLCTYFNYCLSGFCTGTPVDCGALDQCHYNACDPGSGYCLAHDVTDGTSCSDGNACTTGDSCQSGVCTAGAGCVSPSVCGSVGCCIPDFQYPTEVFTCCSGVVDDVGGFCQSAGLGGSCTEDRNCGGALQPACCDGVCRDLASDPLNCGVCGVHITPGAFCINGVNQCQLPHGDRCTNPDRCVDLQIDLDNCGACGAPAPIGGVCFGGVPQCTPGFHNDNGRCCPSGSHNAGDQCCVDGFDSCGGVCSSVTTDPLNCGSCGHHCDVGHGFCIDGHCCSIIGECL